MDLIPQSKLKEWKLENSNIYTVTDLVLALHSRDRLAFEEKRREIRIRTRPTQEKYKFDMYAANCRFHMTQNHTRIYYNSLKTYDYHEAIHYSKYLEDIEYFFKDCK